MRGMDLRTCLDKDTQFTQWPRLCKTATLYRIKKKGVGIQSYIRISEFEIHHNHDKENYSKK